MAKVKQQELDGAGNVVDKPAKAPKAPKEPKAAKAKTKKVRLITFVGEVPEGVKVPLQLGIIINHLRAMTEPLTVIQLAEVVAQDKTFITRQPVERVINFYLPTLQEKNVIRIDTTEIVLPVEDKRSGEEDRRHETTAEFTPAAEATEETTETN